MLPHLVVTSPGNVDIVWVGTTATGDPNGVCGTTLQNEENMPQQCMDATHNVNDGMACETSACTAADGGMVDANWSVYMAQSLNALTKTPQFTITQVSPGYVHQGEICVNGIVCGNSDRSLLDYISVAVDCSGDAHVAYANNYQVSGATPTVHEADQTSGDTLTPPTTCASGTPLAEFPLGPLLPLLGAGVAGAVALGRRRMHRVELAG